MTMQQVLYVLTVARCRNVSRAAQELILSQPALSQQLRRLEAELGYELFFRTTSGMELTPVGERFCEQAAALERAWQEFGAHVQKDAVQVRRRLRIGMGSRVYSNGLFSDIVRFFDAQPELSVTFVTEAGLDFLTQLRRGTLDLALDRMPSDEAPEAGLCLTPLVREPQCVLFSPEDPRARLHAMTLAELAGCDFVTGLENSAEDRTLRDAFRRSGVSPGRVYRSDGIETNMDLVRRGRGVTLGPRSFADYFGVRAVELLPRTEVSLCFICPESKLALPEIRRFRAELISLCQKIT